jgi:carbon-monoxide dehydrogenase medium subunit
VRNLREYFRPASIEEALKLKRDFGECAAYIAGGSDLLVHRPERLEAVIDVRKIGIDAVDLGLDGVSIGGAAKLRDVERLAGQVAGGMLVSAVRETAPWLVRNAATLAGNVANASPAADSVPALVALDARLVLFDGHEEMVPIQDVLLGPHQTSLGDRLVRGIVIAPEAARRSAAFSKLARSKSDIAQVNVAVSISPNGSEAHDVRIVLGAVAPTAMRARHAESLLEGQTPTPEILRAVEAAVREEVSPISDWRASADYRRRAAGVLVRRAVAQAWQNRMRLDSNGDEAANVHG